MNKELLLKSINELELELNGLSIPPIKTLFDDSESFRYKYLKEKKYYDVIYKLANFRVLLAEAQE